MLAGVFRVGKKKSPGRLIENGPMDQDLDPAQSQGGKTNLRREIRMKGQIPLINSSCVLLSLRLMDRVALVFCILVSHFFFFPLSCLTAMLSVSSINKGCRFFICPISSW